jgi:hypothetical protein
VVTGEESRKTPGREVDAWAERVLRSSSAGWEHGFWLQICNTGQDVGFEEVRTSGHPEFRDIVTGVFSPALAKYSKKLRPDRMLVAGSVDTLVCCSKPRRNRLD